MSRPSVSLAWMLALACASAVFAPPAFAGLKGKVKKGVYEAPAGNFTVPVPGGMGMRVNDGFRRDKDGELGAVSFNDDFGHVDMITYVSLPSAPSFPDSESEMKMLDGFLRDVAMPTWFVPASHRAEVVQSAPGTFKGKRALVALISLPEGSTMVNMGTKKRMDSKRGVVIFFNGRWTYLIGTETMSALDLAAASAKDSTGATSPPPPWDSFTSWLERFHKTIAFAD